MVLIAMISWRGRLKCWRSGDWDYYVSRAGFGTSVVWTLARILSRGKKVDLIPKYQLNSRDVQRLADLDMSS